MSIYENSDLYFVEDVRLCGEILVDCANDLLGVKVNKIFEYY